MDNRLEKEVSDRFDKDFNQIDIKLLERAYPNGELLDAIFYPEEYESEEFLYPMWNTLFEARDNHLSTLLKDNVNKLSDIGIYLMEVEETNAMMFIIGAGYDFYRRHWIPLYRDVLGWVK